MTPFVDRMIRAAKLDVNLYEEVEADKNAMSQAVGVVALSSLAGGIAFMQQAGLTGLVIGTAGSLLGWYIWAFLTYVIGTKLLPEPQTRADHGELLRTIGFSSAPGILRIFGIIPDARGHGDCRAPSLGLSQYLSRPWGVSDWLDCASPDSRIDFADDG
jgi:hypothetical protein